MNETIGIIPYYGGIGDYSPDHTQQALHEREKWFFYCLHSLKKVVNRFYVGCCTDKDELIVNNYSLMNNFQTLRFKDIKPEFLPYYLVKKVQDFYSESKEKADFVYYTEMDQTFYCKSLDNLKNICASDNYVYFSPQRFEQIPKIKVEERKRRFSVNSERFVEFKGYFSDDNNPYVVANEPMDIEDYDDDFYINKKDDIIYKDLTSGYYGGAYGAAWFTSSTLFNETQFDAIQFQPTEQIGGHCLLRHHKSKCLKSKDYFYFHVDHLSGYEFNKNL